MNFSTLQLTTGVLDMAKGLPTLGRIGDALCVTIGPKNFQMNF